MFQKYLLLPALLLTGLLFPSDTTAQVKKEKKEIIIRGDDKGEKTVIVIEGDKVTVNGKEMTGEDKETIIMKRTATHPRVFMFNTDSLMSPTEMLRSFDLDADGPKIRIFDAEGEQQSENIEVRAQLGVLTQPNEKGIEVVDVTQNSSAEKAGLKARDIITSVDDRPMKEPLQLVEYIGSKKGGEVVNIDILREGRKEKISATLGEMRMVKRFRTLRMPEERGDVDEIERIIEQSLQESNIELRTQRPKLGMQVEEQSSGKGLKVLEVKADAPAAKAGLKPGDIIEQIEGRSVNSLDEMNGALKEGSLTFQMDIRRNGKAMTLKCSIPKTLRKGDF